MQPNKLDKLILSETEPGIWTIVVNRPKALNSLNRQTIEQLIKAFNWIERQKNARVILLTGEGEKAFIAGADILEMKDMTSMEAREFSQLGMSLTHLIENNSLPVIALVNGYCLGGGCEIAMSCDFILASENAVFGQPEVTIGIPPGFGGSQRLARKVGAGIANQLLLTGEKIDANEAYRIGLCNKVYSLEELLKTGLNQARKISLNAPKAVHFTKQLAKKSSDLDIQNGCDMETELFSLCFSTQDQKEGMTAFSERRKAKYTGH